MSIRMSLSAGLACLLPLAAASAALGCSSGRSGSANGAGSSGGSSSSGGADGDAATTSPPPDQRPAGVALCYTPLADKHPATTAFWAAFAAARPEARADAIRQLQTAVLAYPKEEELALLLGLANLWRVAEPLASEASDQSGMIQAALAAQSNLQTAITLCPTDYRIDAWLAPVLVQEGQALGAQSTIDQGMQDLQQGIDHYPSFVLFSKLLVYADRPASDPDFQQALQAVQDDLGACGNPATSPDPACRDTPHAAHNIEGAAVFLGDVYAKAGRKTDALGMYNGAKTGPAYASWAFKDLLDQRIATIDARIAAAGASADGGASGVDNVWGSTIQCTICHQQ